jgi:hypothetical protein
MHVNADTYIALLEINTNYVWDFMFTAVKTSIMIFWFEAPRSLGPTWAHVPQLRRPESTKITLIIIFNFFVWISIYTQSIKGEKMGL